MIGLCTGRLAVVRGAEGGFHSIFEGLGSAETRCRIPIIPILLQIGKPVLLLKVREINTDGEMSPRTLLASVPYAYKAESLVNAPTRVLTWYLPHDAEVGTNKSAYLIVPFSGQIVQATAYAKTAPTGAMALKIDIHKNGTTIWGDQNNRLQFVAGANTATSSTFTTTSVTANDCFTVDIDSVGSTLPGTDITVILQIKETT